MTIKSFFQVNAIGFFILFLYHGVLLHIVSKWSVADGSHGPLILVVSFYLIWIQRKRIAKLPVEPEPWRGGLLTSVGCFTLFAGNLLNILSLQELSLIPVLLGIIWMLWGTAVVKVFFLPVGYLVFVTGIMGEILGATLGFKLQIITAWSAAKMLTLSGLPVFLSKTIIHLPHISLEVVQECSGIIHLIAILALALPLAFLTQKSPSAKVVLIFASFLIGIFANVLRVTLIGLHTLYNPGTSVHGNNETLRVSFVFLLGMVLLVLFSQILKKVDAIRLKTRQDVVNGQAAEKVSDLEPSPKDAAIVPAFKRSMPMTPTVILLVITIALMHFYKPKAIYLQKPLQTFSTHFAGYSSMEITEVDPRIRPLPADDEFMRIYADPSGHAVEVYIGYYALQGKDHRVFDWRRKWMHTEAVAWNVPCWGDVVAINKTRVRESQSSAVAYFWYVIDDRIVTSRFVGTLFTLWNILLKRKSNAAVIIIQTDDYHRDIKPLIGDLLSKSRNHLSNPLGF